MDYTVENDLLRLTVSSHGAELQDLRRKAAPDVPLLWDGKKEHWPRRAPLCFPWCSRVEENWYQAGGKRYENLPQHGFVRDLEHTLVKQGEGELVFRLEWPGDGERWPWKFSFETRHALIGNVLETTCTAVNLSDSPMPVQLGFHVGLSCPFTPGTPLEDHFIRFEKPEAPDGSDRFLLDHHRFDENSVCFEALKSAWLQVEDKAGKYLRVETKDWPYVLLWSAPGMPGFVCIEPWTGYLGPGHDLMDRPGTTLVAPGETFSRTHRLTVEL